MANRIIKESICESKPLSEVSFFAEDLYKRLITYADDYGRFNADYQIILARLYPREIQIVSLDDIEDAMTELIGAGKISFYTSKAKKEVYGCFPNWDKHQRIRESKAKTPEPDDTEVNDWYLRRYISFDLKKRIIERDGFKCKECSKYICAGVNSAERLIKMGAGLFHIDHIVPVSQGGRATEENLRLLCPKCNLGRKRRFSFEELLNLDGSPQVAASCGELPQDAEKGGFNPIQSKTESESKSKIGSSEPSPKAPEPLADVEAIPLNNGEEYRLPQSDYEEFSRLYPGVDIKQEFRNMRGWSLKNPAKRKTARGVGRFINTWLSKEQDKSHKTTPSGGYQRSQAASGYDQAVLGRLLNETRDEFLQRTGGGGNGG